MRACLWLLLPAFAAACTEQRSEPPRSLAPAPLPRVPLAVGPVDGGVDAEREALHRVEAAERLGHELPRRRLEVRLTGDVLEVGAERLEAAAPATAARLAELAKGKDALVVKADKDAFVAQLAPGLAALDDAKVPVWLQDPDAPLAYPLHLRDEKAFQAWLDEPRPGKVRIIQRADGFELQTNVGKLPGSDRNGPTVPARGGQLDIATLRRGLFALKGRFKDAPDACLLPSYGTEVSSLASALTGMYGAKGEPIFEELCLVYPRPSAGGDR